MIRLIIVEDEQIIRNGLVRHMPWQKLGIGEIQTAANAEEAFKVCETFQPDIIVSDIRMPGMNGIDLCTKFREKLPDSQIIFISGFSDKEYLMAAIQLGAVSYVEKPISIQDLSEAIVKATASIHKLSHQKTGLLHSLLCLDTEKTSIKSFLQNENGQALKWDTQFWIAILKMRNRIQDVLSLSSTFKEKLNSFIEKGQLHFTADSPDTSTIVMLISTNGDFQSEEELQKRVICENILLAAEQKGDCFLGIGDKVFSLEQLPSSYRTAIDALKSLSYKGWNQYAFSLEKRSEYSERLPETVLNTFYRQLLDNESESAQTFLNEIYRKLIASHAILNFHVRNLYYRIACEISRAEQMMALSEQSISKPGNTFMDQAQTIQEMHDYVSHRILQYFQENKHTQMTNVAIKNVLNYLNEKPEDENISIQMLADMVYLTPTYLSSVFKKHTGLTIGQYLTKVRMEKAQEYLSDPQFKLYQIAAMVGYKDANYFGKIFKKQTGMLPSEYRESKTG